MQKSDLFKQLGLPFMNTDQQSEEDIDEEEMDDEQKQKNWQENRAFLYDHLIVHTLSAPTSAVQWLPQTDDAVTDRKNYLVTGTSDSENPNNNFLSLYSVNLPKFKPTIDVAEEARAPPKENADQKKHSIKLEKRLAHPGDVNRLAYMPQESQIVATKSDLGTVNLFRLDATESSAPFSVLKALTESGFGLNWSTTDNGHIVSSGVDGHIAVWDALNRPNSPTTLITDFKTSVNVDTWLLPRMSNSTLSSQE